MKVIAEHTWKLTNSEQQEIAEILKAGYLKLHKDCIIITEETYDNEIYYQYCNGFMDGTKQTATEILTYLHKRKLVDKYELNKLAEQYKVEIKE